jgi:hypothetical protein
VESEALGSMPDNAEQPKKKQQKERNYPAPGFTLGARSNNEGELDGYTVAEKLKAVAYARVLCADGQPVGKKGAATALRVNLANIKQWCGDEAKLKVAADSGLGTKKKQHSGPAPSSAEIDSAKVDFVNECRKDKLAVTRHDIINKALQLDSKFLGGQPSAADGPAAELWMGMFEAWYGRWRHRNALSVRRVTSAGRKAPEGYEGVAYHLVTVTLRQALIRLSMKLKANAAAPAAAAAAAAAATAADDSKEVDDTASVEYDASLELYFEQILANLYNGDQTPIFQESPSPTTLDREGVLVVPVKTAGKEKSRVTVMAYCIASGWKGRPRIVHKGKKHSSSSRPKSNSIQAEFTQRKKSAELAGSPFIVC